MNIKELNRMNLFTDALLKAKLNWDNLAIRTNEGSSDQMQLTFMIKNK